MLILILMTSLFITLALGFYVLVAAPHRVVNRTFALFVGMMALWIVKDLAFWGFHDPEGGAAWWATVSFILGITLQLVFLYFADIFPDIYPNSGPPRRRRLLLAAAPLAVFLPALLLGKFWTHAGFHHGRFSIALTMFAYAAGIYNLLLLAAGVRTMRTKYQQHRDSIWGKQIASVIAAMLVTAGLMVASVNLLPALGIYELLPFCSIFIVVGALIYAYAITNFQLFSLQTALDQLKLFPLAYKVAITVALTGIFGFLLCQVPVALWAFGADAAGWKKFLVFSTISGMIPSLVLILLIVRILSRPLRDLTEVALDVARGNYGAETPLTSNDELGVLASSFNVMSRKMAEDIARLKDINQAMMRSEKLAVAGALATGVAHEVNNPLASISSLVQLQLAGAADERDRETLRLILAQITRITSVLRDLMDFARPKAPELRLTDLNQVLAKSIELARYDKRFKNLAVRTAFAAPLPPLPLDADRMQQVFLNLLLNARDAIGDETADGEITITTSQVNGEILAEIADNGAGIPAENLPRLFDPFFSTKSKGHGTGLGLAVCHSIITAHGGRISATPKARGAAFTVALPTLV
jgi:signal transduction histidine kinase